MPYQRLPSRLLVRLVVAFSLPVLLAACGEKPQAGPPGDMKVPVNVVTVQPERIALYTDLPGRVQAIKDAEIRARVTGIVKEIHFRQGSDVKAGQKLFTIDPAPYEAARDQASAQLKRAQADARSARLLSQRYAKLIKENAISRQDHDNATATAAQAEAAVASAQAALRAAEIDLGYTEVVSPIDGRIGRSLVTEGALVSATQATQLAAVQQIDRVYVDVTRSTIELAQLRKAAAEGLLKPTAEGARAEIRLEDGSRYEHEGELLFSGIAVDPGTGQVSLRAEFANPDQILLPGMYVRVRLEQGVDEKALGVPEQALQRTSDGLNSLMVVKDGKVTPVAVSVGPSVDGKQVITKGLQPGDMVVVAGFQKIRPGAAVQPIPWKGATGGAAPNGAAPAGAAPAGGQPAQSQQQAAPAQG